MVAIAGFTKDQILSAVRDMYSEVANLPSKQFHFPTGRSACLFVGYPEDLLDRLPASAVESFAGVGFPFRADLIRPGDRVLDIGAGSGTDTLIAARAVAPGGRVFALDMTPAMLAKLRKNVALAGAANVEVVEGNAEVCSTSRCKRRRGHQQRRLEPGTGQSQSLCRDFSRAAARRPGSDRRHRRRAAGGRGRARRSQAVGRVRGWGLLGRGLRRAFPVGRIRRAPVILRRYDYFAGSASTDTRRVAHSLGAMAVELRICK